MKEKKYQLKSKEDGLDNHTEVTFSENGAIYFSDREYGSEAFIYLYPKQARRLLEIITKKSSKSSGAKKK